MEDNEEQKKEKKQVKQINIDELPLESENYYSSFGRMIPSKLATAAKYGFGTATRKK